MTDAFTHPDAACREQPELFIGEWPGRQGRRIARQARDICLACAGYQPCHEWARHNWQAGFMAGLTERERAYLYGVGDITGAHPDVRTIARRWQAARPEPEPRGRFANRPDHYRIPAHHCATDGCNCTVVA